jgi:oligogalacturonide lyase
MAALSRRLLLSGLAASLLPAEGGKGTHFESDWRRYADPTTELQVFRLTDSAYASILPASYNRPIPRRGNFLLFCCDRSGSPQLFRMDLKSGDATQLTDDRDIDPHSLALSADGRTAVFFAGRSVHALALSNLRQRELYTVPDGWERCEGCSLIADGSAVLFGERQDASGSRLRSVTVQRPSARTIVQAPFEIRHPIGRPVRAQALYHESPRALWLVNSDGRQNRKLQLAEGGIGAADWSVDGRTVLYLRFPDDPKQLTEIREHSPDTNTDRLVAKTSQFADFGFNRDSSVFVGASRNAASPTVLLLLRVTRREFTLCEHTASEAAAVNPFFSPDAQRIYFQSDRHGKPAIYCMHVEKLVEKIESET